MEPPQARRRSLGLSASGERLRVSFHDAGDDRADGGGGTLDAGAAAGAVSPGWLRRDLVDLELSKEEALKHPRADAPALSARAKAVDRRRDLRATGHARSAAASPRARAGSPERSWRAASPTRPLRPAAHNRPWASQHAVESTAEGLWKRSSAAEMVQSLESLASTLNHPRPLVGITARRSVESIAGKGRTAVTESVSGRMSASEFVRKLRGPTARDDSHRRTMAHASTVEHAAWLGAERPRSPERLAAGLGTSPLRSPTRHPPSAAAVASPVPPRSPAVDRAIDGIRTAGSLLGTPAKSTSSASGAASPLRASVPAAASPRLTLRPVSPGGSESPKLSAIQALGTTLGTRSVSPTKRRAVPSPMPSPMPSPATASRRQRVANLAAAARAGAQ